MKLNALMVRYIVNDVDVAIKSTPSIWGFASLLNRAHISRSSRGRTCSWF